jgi:hypothetical protein
MKFKDAPVKYVCDKCKNIERYTVFEYIVKVFAQLMMGLGIFLFVFVVYFGPNVVVSSFMNFNTLNYAKQYNAELRDLALNLTYPVNGEDPFVIADKLAEGLGRVRYVLPSPFQMIQDPIETYNKGGDCKNTAIFFSAMMTTLGFKSTVICDVGHDHCVSKIMGRGDYSNMYMIMDLASARAETYYNGDDFWSDNSTSTWSKSYLWKSKSTPINYPINLD